jgi:hypothetical protein
MRADRALMFRVVQRRGASLACSLGAIIAIASVGCTHDFSIFEPVAADDASVATGNSGDAGFESTPDAGSPEAAAVDAGVDAQTTKPGEDAAPPKLDGSVADDGSPCASDPMGCKTEATSCAGLCAEDEQSCLGACAQGDSTCENNCTASESTCTAQCVTTCENCTSNEGCIDQAGCTAAAP